MRTPFQNDLKAHLRAELLHTRTDLRESQEKMAERLGISVRRLRRLRAREVLLQPGHLSLLPPVLLRERAGLPERGARAPPSRRLRRIGNQVLTPAKKPKPSFGFFFYPLAASSSRSFS